MYHNLFGKREEGGSQYLRGLYLGWRAKISLNIELLQGSITVWLTSSLDVVDSTKQVNLLLFNISKAYLNPNV